MAASIGMPSRSLAATISDADIFDGSETVTVSSTFNNAAFSGDHVVDGLASAHVFGNNDIETLSITGFNSSIDTLRFFDTPSYTRRLGSAVTLYYSGASTTSLDPNNYTLVGTFTLPGMNAPVGDDNVDVLDVYTNLTSPADHPLASDPATHTERTISYADATGLGIPAGTQSLLMVFEASDPIIGIGLTEIQAFSVPEPTAIAISLLGAATALTARRRQN